jgi:ferric-dicitrate binding protein FerR (iron transport regulator)
MPDKARSHRMSHTAYERRQRRKLLWVALAVGLLAAAFVGLICWLSP